jgi:hypothetical protein
MPTPATHLRLVGRLVNKRLVAVLICFACVMGLMQFTQLGLDLKEKPFAPSNAGGEDGCTYVFMEETLPSVRSMNVGLRIGVDRSKAFFFPQFRPSDATLFLVFKTSSKARVSS